jgi:hypothetical protein
MKLVLFAMAVIASVSGESLQYVINWPSGLSLGEATLVSGTAQGQWQFTLEMDASVPGLTLRDRDRSSAGTDLCSIQLDKVAQIGAKKGEEKITFDQQKHTITRQTLNGGASTVPVPACAKDALTFLQFVRSELAQGRIVADQAVVFGTIYQVHLESKGTQTITAGGKTVNTDHIVAVIKGPSAALTVDLFFTQDPARIPVLARLPLALGIFSVELEP